MKFLLAIDRWLISKVFQPIVNKSGRKPAWWCEQSALLLGVATIGRLIADDATQWSLRLVVGIFALVVACMWVQARFIPHTLPQEEPIWRWMSSVLLLFAVGTLHIDNDIFLVARSFAFSVYFWFAACANPPPRKRKEEKKAIQVPLFGTLTPNQG